MVFHPLLLETLWLKTCEGGSAPGTAVSSIRGVQWVSPSPSQQGSGNRGATTPLGSGGPQPGPSLARCHSSQLKEPRFSKGEQKLCPLIHDWGAESSHSEDPFSPGEETFTGSEVVVLPELGERSGDFQKQPEPAQSFGPRCAKAKCKYPLGAGIPGWEGGKGNFWAFGSPVRRCHPRDGTAPGSGQVTVATLGLSGSGWFPGFADVVASALLSAKQAQLRHRLPDCGVGKKKERSLASVQARVSSR